MKYKDVLEGALYAMTAFHEVEIDDEDDPHSVLLRNGMALGVYFLLGILDPKADVEHASNGDAIHIGQARLLKYAEARGGVEVVVIP